MHKVRAGREKGCLRLLLLVLGYKVGATEPRREALSREVMALSVSGKFLQSRKSKVSIGSCLPLQAKCILVNEYSRTCLWCGQGEGQWYCRMWEVEV